MKPENLVLRCFAEQDKDGTWFTMCIDLNLYARGDDFKEARAKLHRFMAEYLNDAVSHSEHTYHLVRRKAPLYFFARYYWIALLCNIGVVLHRSRAAAEKLHRCLFTEILPVRFNISNFQ